MELAPINWLKSGYLNNTTQCRLSQRGRLQKLSLDTSEIRFHRQIISLPLSGIQDVNICPSGWCNLNPILGTR